jgi:gamma-glutamylcyclotransferase (GGCT)/AIG2-like uncharacterized protein YtfP
MPLVFQYGSNLSSRRLNGADRLRGGARVVATARTLQSFRLDFTVWSPHNHCAAADLVVDEAGRSIHGVVYEIPERLIYGYHEHMTLDRIELEGHSYRRESVAVWIDGTDELIHAWTYRVKQPQWNLLTQIAYVQHLFLGLKEHAFPDEYRAYVVDRVLRNNPALQAELFEMINDGRGVDPVQWL